MSAGPLDGVTVCDFTVALSGPIATLALANLGARVVKVEHPRNPARTPLIGAAASIEVVWASRHGGKESIAIDLRSAEGLAVAQDLISRSDVVVENFRPGAIDRLGLGYDAVRPLNPGLIYASLTGYPACSAWGDFSAYDPQAQAAAGVTGITGVADRPPTRPGAPLSDLTSGLVLTAAIVAALFQKRRTGEGQSISVSMLDTSMHVMRSVLASTAVTGQLPLRAGNMPLFSSPTETRSAIACRGGGENDFCLIELTNDAQWQALLAVTEMTALANDRLFLSAELRAQHEPELSAALASWFGRRSKHEAMRDLLAGGVPAAAVLTPHDLVHDPELQSSDTFLNLALADDLSVRSVAWPVKLASHQRVPTRGPGLGEHTEAILCGLLGRSAADLRRLQSEGAVA